MHTEQQYQTLKEQYGILSNQVIKCKWRCRQLEQAWLAQSEVNFDLKNDINLITERIKLFTERTERIKLFTERTERIKLFTERTERIKLFTGRIELLEKPNSI